MNTVCILQALTHQLVVELRSEPRPVLDRSLPSQIHIPYSEGILLLLALLPSSFMHSSVQDYLLGIFSVRVSNRHFLYGGQQ